MDRAIIVKAFNDYRDYLDNLHGVEIRAICTDTDFMLVQLGWTRSGQREYSVIAHFVIRDQKLWIEYNATEFLVDDLRKAGIHSDAIVLGFLPANRDQFVEYAPV